MDSSTLNGSEKDRISNLKEALREKSKEKGDTDKGTYLTARKRRENDQSGWRREEMERNPKSTPCQQ